MRPEWLILPVLTIVWTCWRVHVEHLRNSQLWGNLNALCCWKCAFTRMFSFRIFCKKYSLMFHLHACNSLDWIYVRTGCCFLWSLFMFTGACWRWHNRHVAPFNNVAWHRYSNSAEWTKGTLGRYRRGLLSAISYHYPALCCQWRWLLSNTDRCIEWVKANLVYTGPYREINTVHRLKSPPSSLSSREIMIAK